MSWLPAAGSRPKKQQYTPLTFNRAPASAVAAALLFAALTLYAAEAGLDGQPRVLLAQTPPSPSLLPVTPDTLAAKMQWTLADPHAGELMPLLFPSSILLLVGPLVVYWDTQQLPFADAVEWLNIQREHSQYYLITRSPTCNRGMAYRSMRLISARAGSDEA